MRVDLALDIRHRNHDILRPDERNVCGCNSSDHADGNDEFDQREGMPLPLVLALMCMRVPERDAVDGMSGHTHEFSSHYSTNICRLLGQFAYELP